ncbi:MAG: aldehyde ferredoxin oxidoreductase N-terminal domain-containing protein, partial [Sulfolobales archaeon]
MSSYAGRVLDIDLSYSKVSTYKIDEKILKKFIGGKGLGAKLLIDNLGVGVSPLSPENILIFATGPLTGTGAPTASRFVVVTKSPLTGLFTDSHVGGSAGPEIKKAGYDAIIVRGKAQHPVYIWVDDESVEIRDASKLWGLTVSKTVDAVRALTDPKAHVGVIGPAGERLVKYACIVFDKEEERNGIAARGGPGAVMGSKNLKAIAIKGSHKVGVVNPEGFQKAVADALKSINENPFIPFRRKYGTAYWVKPMNEHAIIPSLNFQRGSLEGAEKLYADYMRSTCVVKDIACHNCPII